MNGFTYRVSPGKFVIEAVAMVLGHKGKEFAKRCFSVEVTRSFAEAAKMDFPGEGMYVMSEERLSKRRASIVKRKNSRIAVLMDFPAGDQERDDV